MNPVTKAKDLLNFSFHAESYGMVEAHVISEQTQHKVDRATQSIRKFVEKCEAVPDDYHDYAKEYYEYFIYCAPYGLERLKKSFPTKHDCSKLARIITYMPDDKDPIILTKHQRNFPCNLG